MRWEETPVLVTGGDGFIGCRLVSKLKEFGASVAVASKSRGGDGVICIDVAKPETLNFEGYEVVFHLAGIADPKICEAHPEQAFLVNSYGSLNVAEECERSGVKRMLLSSSSHVYGIPEYIPVDEKHPLAPVSVYGRSKVAAEHAWREYGGAVLRFFNVYGKGQRGDYLIPTILSQLNKGSVKLKNLDSRRDFVHVDDVVDALLVAVDFPGECFNIGSGRSYSVKEIAELLFKISNKKPKLISLNKRDRVRNLVADIGKAKRIMGWEPRVDLGEGLREVYEGFG